MKDLLEYLYDTYGFDRQFIRQVASGKRYFAVELVNGSIGVCATLGDKITEIPQWLSPDVIRHRIILTAYFNAMLNYRSENVLENNADIVDNLDFSKYENIHIVGKFSPVFEKLQNRGIKFTYSDLREEDDPQNMISSQKELVKQSDCLIISATAVYNGTFNDLIALSQKADRFLLGPSALLTPHICSWGIKISFGVRFKLYDSRVLGLISQDYGTKYFLRRGKKVALKCDITKDL